MAPVGVRGRLLAVLCEALTDVARHAKAHDGEVRLTAIPGRPTLDVHDDGIGTPSTGRRSGLTNLRRRPATRGGTLNLAPNGSTGTRLSWSVPNGRPADTGHDGTLSPADDGRSGITVGSTTPGGGPWRSQSISPGPVATDACACSPVACRDESCPARLRCRPPSPSPTCWTGWSVLVVGETSEVTDPVRPAGLAALPRAARGGAGPTVTIAIRLPRLTGHLDPAAVPPLGHDDGRSVDGAG